MVSTKKLVAFTSLAKRLPFVMYSNYIGRNNRFGVLWQDLSSIKSPSYMSFSLTRTWNHSKAIWFLSTLLFRCFELFSYRSACCFILQIRLQWPLYFWDYVITFPWFHSEKGSLLSQEPWCQQKMHRFEVEHWFKPFGYDSYGVVQNNYWRWDILLQ